jgi:hypothetical protein
MLVCVGVLRGLFLKFLEIGTGAESAPGTGYDDGPNGVISIGPV